MPTRQDVLEELKKQGGAATLKDMKDSLGCQGAHITSAAKGVPNIKIVSSGKGRWKLIGLIFKGKTMSECQEKDCTKKAFPGTRFCVKHQDEGEKEAAAQEEKKKAAVKRPKEKKEHHLVTNFNELKEAELEKNEIEKRRAERDEQKRSRVKSQTEEAKIDPEPSPEEGYSKKLVTGDGVRILKILNLIGEMDVLEVKISITTKCLRKENGEKG